ncbi:hypothetical protein [Salarchaeum japonicum]|uniref:DUF2254 domain-containing protein n=1 Tax=Salarchaeum japonicum TaxID=555573 RepID=A0AAV3SYS6_9EURY|nr:hypothetical protein [Salarchaeum japonicum]
MDFRALPDFPRFNLGVSLLIGLLSSGLLLILPADSISSLFQVLALAQASLLAIIVSVGLLSVQIAANQFTPLIGRRFEEDEFLTSTILRFGASIALALIAMLLIPELYPLTGRLPLFGLVLLIAAGTGGATFSFLSVIEVKDDMLNYLNPESILDDLLEDVSFEAYRSFSEELQENGPTARSPVLEIFQIGQRAFEDNDNHTALYAIHTLDKASQKILTEYGELTEEERRDVSFHQRDLFDYWKRLIDSAVENGTDKTLYQIVLSQKEIATVAAENRLSSVGGEAAKTLQYLCEQAYQRDRLDKGYYARFKHILEASIKYDVPGIANSTVIYMKSFAFTITRDFEHEGEHRSWEESIVDNLFAYLRDTWSKVFEEKSGQIKDGEYRDLHDRFEKTIGHYVSTCWAFDRPYPSNLESDLTSVAISAAENDEQWAVSRITRMLIELWVITERRDSRRINGLARIIDSGGRKGVEDAFDHILSYEHVDPDDMGEPVVIGEDDWEEKMEQQSSKMYDNVVEGIGRLNSVPDFREHVVGLREQMETRYNDFFADSDTQR